MSWRTKLSIEEDQEYEKFLRMEYDKGHRSGMEKGAALGIFVGIAMMLIVPWLSQFG